MGIGIVFLTSGKRFQYQGEQKKKNGSRYTAAIFYEMYQ
jgi:hypothetical protein